MKEKIRFSEEIIKEIEAIDFVEEVILRGSLANGGNDRYTDIDIDISIYLNETDLSKVSSEVKEKLNAKFKILIDDWGMTFMPKDFVHTIYFDIDNLFSFLDIEYHFLDMSKVDYSKIENNPISHDLKLLVLNIKRVSRDRADDVTLNWMHDKLIGKTTSSSFIEKLKDLIEYLDSFELNENQLNILRKCKIELSRLTNEYNSA
jgi:predicted nucleotidyltransferase